MWKQYRRKGLSEMRPYVPGETLAHEISISEADRNNGSPKEGDMIARNPKNHADQWLVAKKYFDENLEPADEEAIEAIEFRTIPSHSFRTILDHKLTGLNDALAVTVLDAHGPGGANHHYVVSLPSYGRPVLDVQFQNGPIGEVGFNGISNEVLLAIVIDRLRGFQHRRKRGPLPAGIDTTGMTATEITYLCPELNDFDFNSRGQYACRENALALTHVEEALMWLQKRTRDRMARGVEGTSRV